MGLFDGVIANITANVIRDVIVDQFDRVIANITANSCLLFIKTKVSNRGVDP